MLIMVLFKCNPQSFISSPSLFHFYRNRWTRSTFECMQQQVAVEPSEQEAKRVIGQSYSHTLEIILRVWTSHRRHRLVVDRTLISSMHDFRRPAPSQRIIEVSCECPVKGQLNWLGWALACLPVCTFPGQ